jgi:hypothetical protein
MTLIRTDCQNYQDCQRLKIEKAKSLKHGGTEVAEKSKALPQICADER